MKENGGIRADARKRIEAAALAVASLPRFHDSKTPKQTCLDEPRRTVFEGREVVSYPKASGTVTLREGRVIQLAARKRRT